TPEMKKKLVCAYVVGFGIYPEKYELLKPCADSTEINCYVTWSSYKDGYIPKKDLMLIGKTCVNPISWKMDTLPATSSCGVFLNLNRKKCYRSTARIKDNYLWVKTNMPVIRHVNIMHFVDFNLFWYDVRNNARLRVNEYLKKNK
ncbi:MAG: hypothetical protein JWN78_1978, partial [Bacteroidota bacterium]|nr:hypothetical protein [Bacteroidota bacterium]